MIFTQKLASTLRGKPPRVKGIHRNIWRNILGGRNISLQRILNLPQLVNRCLTLTSASPPITGMWPRGPDYHLPTSGKTQNFFTPSQFVYKLLSRKFFVSDFATAVVAQFSKHHLWVLVMGIKVELKAGRGLEGAEQMPRPPEGVPRPPGRASGDLSFVGGCQPFCGIASFA